MSVYKLMTENGSRTIKEATALLAAKYLQQGIRHSSKEDLQCLDPRPEVQRMILDALIVEVGKYTGLTDMTQDQQNQIFGDLRDERK